MMKDSVPQVWQRSSRGLRHIMNPMERCRPNSLSLAPPGPSDPRAPSAQQPMRNCTESRRAVCSLYGPKNLSPAFCKALRIHKALSILGGRSYECVYMTKYMPHNSCIHVAWIQGTVSLRDRHRKFPGLVFTLACHGC